MAMSDSNCSLTNNLIEGYLYEILTDWKDFDTIISMVHERFGDGVCMPSDLTKDGSKRYIRRVEKVLARGVMNDIYLHKEATNSYKIKE
jgi:cyanate lyase